MSTKFHNVYSIQGDPTLQGFPNGFTDRRVKPYRTAGRRKPDPSGRQHRQSVQVVPLLNRANLGLDGHADDFGSGTAVAFQNTKAVVPKNYDWPIPDKTKLLNSGVNSSRVMKAFSFFTLIFAASVSFLAADTTLEDFSPQLSTNCQIIWKIPTNNLPTSFWIYRRHGPRIFSVTVISNAIVLASLQSKGFPQPSAKDFFIWEDRGPNYPGGVPSIFSIRPGYATMYYEMPRSDTGSGAGIPSDATIAKHAWDEAIRLGIDPKQLKLKNLTSHFWSPDEKGRDITNRLCGRGVFLSRQLDGILFFGSGDNDWNEGFWIEFGSQGHIRAFSLNWPNLERYKIHQTASPKQIMDCIRAQKVMVLPNDDEPNYFARVKNLAKAKNLIIGKITPYYGEGVFGETPKDDVPPEFMTPIAELEAVANFGNSNATARIISPILSSEVIRLLQKRAK
jgi:hypothetical protein